MASSPSAVMHGSKGDSHVTVSVYLGYWTSRKSVSFNTNACRYEDKLSCDMAQCTRTYRQFESQTPAITTLGDNFWKALISRTTHLCSIWFDHPLMCHKRPMGNPFSVYVQSHFAQWPILDLSKSSYHSLYVTSFTWWLPETVSMHHVEARFLPKIVAIAKGTLDFRK